MKSRDEGFSLVELLLSAAIMTTIAGAVLLMLGPAREWLRVEPERSDLQQRLRTAVGAVQRDLVMAGGGPYIGRGSGPLVNGLAAVMPYSAGDRNDDPARGVFYRGDVLSIVYVPPTPAQARIRHLAPSGGELVLSVEPNCGDAHDRLCGFVPGMSVLLFDAAGGFGTGSITSVLGTTVSVEGRGASPTVDPGGTAWLAEVIQHTYWLDPATPVPRLMRYDGRRTDSPVVDHVVDLRFQYFGASEPPALLPDADLMADEGPWTTYGPKPPAPGHEGPGDEWAPGENCAFRVVDGVHLPRLPALAAEPAIVALDPARFVDGPWCPHAAHPRRFDADLLRIRGVRMTVRVQAASDSFRGRAGIWFMRGGTAASAHSLIPDQEVLVDVWPRNLNLAW